jgi:hypothetical protein
MSKSVWRKGLRAAVQTSLTVLLLLLLPSLAAAAPLAQSDSWWADYFPNQTLSGSPVLSRFDDEIDFDWGEGSPGSGMPADDFSARWTREAWFEDGTYRFTASSDDGLRVWVGEELVIDAWYDQQASWMARDMYISQGIHTVRVEYYEHTGGAVVQVAWKRLHGGAGWLAEYYANKKLEGPPALVRTDSAINFAWEGDAPDPAVPNDKFSVRWTRTLSFPPGTYRFHAAADDGVRLWVDDQLVVDAWYRQGLPNDHWGDLVLDDRPHQVKVEYFEDGGGAHAYVWWERLDSFSGWKGEYYDNLHMYWPPVMTRDDAEINFDWGTAPPVEWMSDDNFSVRWHGEMTFVPGFYRIAVRADDGVKVWMDETRLMIDKWQEMNNELHYVDGTYLSGTHSFKVEYFEKNGHARIQFWVVPTPWKAEYFANPDLAGEPELVRLHEALDFDWGYGTPFPELPADNFSIRWTTQQSFEANRYTFNVTSDDGVRLYVDGELVLDNWQPIHSSMSAARYLSAGEHTVVLEYSERTGAALVRLNWQRQRQPEVALNLPPSSVS